MRGLILLTLGVRLCGAPAVAAEDAEVDRSKGAFEALWEYGGVRRGDAIVVRVDGIDAYEYGNAKPAFFEQARVRRIAAILAVYDRSPILIEGYAGDPDLGLERARWVESALIHSGLPPGRLSTAGHGPSPELKGGRGVEIVLGLPSETSAARTLAPALPKFSGFLREELAYRVRAPDGLAKARSVAQVSAFGRLSPNVTYKLGGRGFYDAVFGLTHHYPDAVARDMRSELTLRDTYIDASYGSADFRLGKQQIVWGEAVGVFVADVVNARDLREFVLPDMDFIRIPQWALDFENSWGDLHSELVWIPFLEFNKLGVPGSDFGPSLAAPAIVNVYPLLVKTSVPSNDPSPVLGYREFKGAKPASSTHQSRFIAPPGGRGLILQCDMLLGECAG